MGQPRSCGMVVKETQMLKNGLGEKAMSDWLFVGHKPLFWIVGVAALAFLWLAVRALKLKCILEFENGMALNYLLKDGEANRKRELLFFPFGISTSIKFFS